MRGLFETILSRDVKKVNSDVLNEMDLYINQLIGVIKEIETLFPSIVVYHEIHEFDDNTKRIDIHYVTGSKKYGEVRKRRSIIRKVKDIAQKELTNIVAYLHLNEKLLEDRVNIYSKDNDRNITELIFFRASKDSNNEYEGRFTINAFIPNTFVEDYKRILKIS